MTITLVNGIESTQIDVFDRGFQFGDGLFETMLCIDGTPCDFEAHWQRLQQGCKRLGFSCPDIHSPVLSAIRRHSRPRGVAKLVVTRGSSARGYACPPEVQPTWVLYLSAAPSYPEEYYRAGIRVKICRTRLASNPQLAGLKHLNSLEQVLARRELRVEHQEGLLRDWGDHFIEGCMSNLFLVKSDTLLTPDLSSAGVNGIMRQNILTYAAQQGIPCDVQPLVLNDINTADEIFVTNSLFGVWPVRFVDDMQFSPGPVTTALVEKFVA